MLQWYCDQCWNDNFVLLLGVEYRVFRVLKQGNESQEITCSICGKHPPDWGYKTIGAPFVSVEVKLG